MPNSFGQKIHVKAIVGNIGLFLHIPAVIAFISIFISLIFKEYFAVYPLLSIGLINIILAHILYRCFFYPEVVHLWDAMISIALGWLICPVFGALQYFWIAKESVLATSAIIDMQNYINALFEAFSGFTSSGLTMVKMPSELGFTFQWIRSFQQWIGGIGLIIFVLSLIEPKTKEYQLYFVETKTIGFAKNLKKTTRSILIIYTAFTLLGVVLFFSFKMPIWQAVNHAMTAISTGGFTITDTSFEKYSLGLKIIAVILMIMGSMSFSLHYQMIYKREFLLFWKNIQNRVFYFILITGSVLFIFLNFKDQIINCIFQFTSSLATCGFRSEEVSKYSMGSKLFMITAMIIGGCSGSTVGGLKVRRVIFLFKSIILRLKSFTIKKEKKVLKQRKVKEEPSGVSLPQGYTTERLYEASTLFFLWIVTLVLCVFTLSFCEKDQSLMSIIFDSASALSNVGLSTGLISTSLCTLSKFILMFVMWLGRLEIIPIIIMFLSFFMPMKKVHKKL